MSHEKAEEKQNIKNQRVKSYFVQAAREIILKEGVENVSVRKVAELAGYAFTTLYNYFKDLNELLLEVKNVMIQDVINYMQQASPQKIYNLDDIKKLNKTYINYYIKQPHIFSFFYSYKLHPVEKSTEVIPDFSMHYLETYRSFVTKGSIKEEDVPIIARTIIYTVQGLLALYFSDNGMTMEIVYHELDTIIDYLLKGRNES